jgi:hypothetical protein
MSFCQEVLECDETNEDVKNELNETNENNTMNSSSDSGFDSSDAEESINDEDEDSTCALDELFVEEVEDLRTENRISNVIEDYDGDFGIFTESDIEEWKRKEEVLIRRYEEGYYRSKETRGGVYKQIVDALKPYITKEALSQLAHPWHTQRNEAMNQSVSAFAPKGRTYSLTASLDCRVALAAGTQIVGYEQLWRLIFAAFHLDFDEDIASYLRQMDVEKNQKRETSQTTTGKRKRSQSKYEKLRKEHQNDIAAQAAGKQYQSGIALRQATKKAKKNTSRATRNPKGTPKEKLRCAWHHTNYCRILGHALPTSKDCFMHRKTKAQRNEATIHIMEEHIAGELKSGSTKKGK